MLDKLIGNTPMIRIDYKYKNIKREMYAKLEYFNYTGSIKDRMVWNIIKKARQEGLLQDKQPIVEATSGNTGISLAAIGALFNHEVHIFMPDWASQERIKLMQLYGANVHLVSKEEGGFREAIKRANQLSKELNAFQTNQFSNQDNLEAHYNTTALEIINQKPDIQGFVNGIGTGGTLIGIAKRLKEYNPKIKIIALEPENMTLLSKKKVIGTHKIEGIGDDFIPDLVNKKLIDEIILINDNDAIYISNLLAKKLGLALGISSGANFLAAVKSNMDKIATTFADDAKKYLTTDLSKNIIPSDKTLIDDLEILNMEVI